MQWFVDEYCHHNSYDKLFALMIAENRCIYCSPIQPVEVPYSREHVIPEAFGSFHNNLVLNEGVCKNCNQHFGNTIDLLFSRGSAEGLLRFDYQLKSPQETHKILKNRVSHSLERDDRFDGLKMEFGGQDGRLVVFLVPQVGFPKIDGSKYVYLSENELNDLSTPLPEGIDKDRGFLLFNSEATEERLNHALKKRGIVFNNTIEEDQLPLQTGEEVDVKITAIVDEMILRCIAKISFNYLTKSAGIDFVVTSQFDPIRNYIRHGHRPNYEIVRPTDTPIPIFNSLGVSQKVGHIITVDWPSNSERILGQVSLFNFSTYEIILSSRYSGIWRPVRSGHLFNLRDRKILRLSKALRWY